jgi:hypothetical protein
MGGQKIYIYIYIYVVLFCFYLLRRKYPSISGADLLAM